MGRWSGAAAKDERCEGVDLSSSFEKLGLSLSPFLPMNMFEIEDWSYLAVESAFCALSHWHKAIYPTSPVSVPWVWRGGWRCGCDHFSDGDPSCPKPQ